MQYTRLAELLLLNAVWQSNKCHVSEVDSESWKIIGKATVSKIGKANNYMANDLLIITVITNSDKAFK